jgi:DNA-directed RNA polymerase specialized sigma24 family protein
MPVARISEILGCSDGTARNVLFRGLSKLRDRWAARAGGEDEQVSPLSGENLGSHGR